MTKIIKTRDEIAAELNLIRKAGKTVGLVPTMGALHKGHESLVLKAVSQNDCVVVSVFVNPTQFNDKNDLMNYPRTPEADIELLTKAGASLIFMPSVDEMYPEPDTRQFNFGLLGEVMEGAHRPGHFNGVAQVVSKLFDIVKPNKAYFGQKDFQQVAIIRQMVKMLNFNIEIISCPIVREADGLAVSSRNMLLTPEKRANAPLIAKTLYEARNKAKIASVQQTIDWVTNEVNGNPHLQVEYFEVSNAETLEPIRDWNAAQHVVGCIVVHAGSVRLIDNIIFK